MQVHVRQCFLHVLDLTSGILGQRVALTPIGAHGGHVLRRHKGPAQQPEGMQLPEPLAVQHVRLAARHMLDITGIDQDHLEARRLQYAKHGNPVYPGRFHHYAADPALLEEQRHLIEVGRIAAEVPHGVFGAVFRNAHVMSLRPNVYAGGVGLENIKLSGQLLAAPVHVGCSGGICGRMRRSHFGAPWLSVLMLARARRSVGRERSLTGSRQTASPPKIQTLSPAAKLANGYMTPMSDGHKCSRKQQYGRGARF